MDRPGDMAHRILLQVADVTSQPKANNHKVRHKSLKPSPSPSLLSPSFPPSESSLSPSLSPSESTLLSPSSSFLPLPSPSESPSFSPAESPLSFPLPPSPSPTEAPTEPSPAPARPSIVVLSTPEHHGVLVTPALSPSQALHTDSNSSIKYFSLPVLLGALCCF